MARILRRSTGLKAACALVLLGVVAPAFAQDDCGLCNRVVVINSELASCFLSDYPALSAKEGAAIVVDLSGCAGTDRGIVEALPSPLAPSTATALEPDVQFMVSRPQLDCLKRKLEEPGLVLDPFARIELASCG